MQKVRVILSIILLQFVCSAVYADGVDELSKRVSGAIGDYFKGRQNRNATVVKFENRSIIKGIGAMRFYQLMVSHIEATGTCSFTDTLKGFNGKDGEFRSSPDSQFLIWIRLTSPGGKLGVGTVIFSRLTDRIEYLKYFEGDLIKEETDLLQIDKFGFERSGFGKEFSIPFSKQILDAASINYGGGEFLFVLKRDFLEVWTKGASNLRRLNRIAIEYPFPEYPAIEDEGLVTVFPSGSRIVVFAGTNFSRQINSWSFDGKELKKGEASSFIPLKACTINGENMVLGIKYMAGLNWFMDEVYLAAFRDGKPDESAMYRKKVPNFYSLACAVSNTELQGLHLVDKDYILRHYDAHFTESGTQPAKSGDSIDVIGEEWLVTTDHRINSDKMIFYDIRKDNREVYSNIFTENISRVKNGIWKGKNGVWVIINKDGESRLEFWSKSHAGN